mgnify:FL=1|tara:strand:- start:493 stop:966 length:474 start_codon:yes stop_codon:yes gene_type:complete
MTKKNIIILDNLRSLNNIGSIFRTCDSFNIEKIILCGICGTPPHREINKTALGATEFVNWEYHKSATKVIDNLKKDNYQIISIEQTKDSTDLNSFFLKKKEKIAFVFGNEVKGVSNEILSISDHSLRIPQFGKKKSMNVSVCVGIVLWDNYLKTSLK